MMLTDDDIKYINSLQQKSPYLRRDVDSNYFKRGCCAVKEVIYIDPYGNVLPCPFLHIYLGNLKKESLADILKRSLQYAPFQKYSQKCLAAEDHDFIGLLRKTYKKIDRVPFTLEELINV
jgi:MoaA/NifB/PqqE/SkfB family radical SAM enzyme